MDVASVTERRPLSVFRVVTTAAVTSTDGQNEWKFPVAGMRLSWPEHLQTARMIGSSGDDQRGVSLALMGIALLLLSQDLLAQELGPPTDRTR